MPDLFTNPLTLGGLRAIALAKGFLRYRDPCRREVWRHRVAFYDRAWREAAEQLGASWRTLDSGIHEIHLNGAAIRVCDNSSPIDDPVTLALVSDKPLTYRILEEQSLATPPHAVFTLKTISRAVEFLRASPGPCVVKPARGTGGGRGITAGVRTRAQLSRAAAAAAIYCDDVLIELQISGDNYRLLYLDGELIDALVRRPPGVTGDGRSDVRRLVRLANEDRLRAGAAKSQVLLTIDPDMRRTLAQQKLSLRSVPAAGRLVTLKTVVNENCGDDNVGCIHTLSPAIIADCARAVRALRIRLAGVDVVTPDPSVPLEESAGVILEVNAPPNFYYHYHQRTGPVPVALHVLRRLLHVDSPPADVRQAIEAIPTEAQLA
jgi:D-alanine-D-alanine ligase-like ATP-grasp enzyme